MDQTVTADGYRVTLHRAYADRLGVRLAMSVEDLDERWSGLHVEGAQATDADGRVFEAWNSSSREPFAASTATWSRFLLPADALGDDLHLRVTVTSLAVRSPEPIPSDPDPDSVWTSVDGAWAFELDVPPFTLGESMSPSAETSANGVAIALKEIGVVPSGTVVRLAVQGLPELPAGSADGWYPVTSIEHDGKRLTDDALPPGASRPDGEVTLEVEPVVEDLAGHWKVTILEFWSPTREPFGKSLGPWVLAFDVPATP